MKISNITSTMTVNPYSAYRRTSQITQKPMSIDKVEISEDAMELYTEKQDIRMDKVEDIKQRIALGSYMINSTDIVEKMLCGGF